MDTSKLSAKIGELQDAKKALEKAQILRSGLRLGHQSQVTITIGSASLSITELNKYYQSSFIRGCEMMALGAAKVLNARVDEMQEIVNSLESEIADLAGAK